MPALRQNAPKQKYPPVDKLKAVILERKLVMGLTYQDLGDIGNCHPSYIRTLLTKRHTKDWNPDVRKAICDYIGIEIDITIRDLFDLSGGESDADS